MRKIAQYEINTIILLIQWLVIIKAKPLEAFDPSETFMANKVKPKTKDAKIKETNKEVKEEVSLN